MRRTNNGLEQRFRSYRYHERRALGRKAASPAAVLLLIEAAGQHVDVPVHGAIRVQRAIGASGMCIGEPAKQSPSLPPS